MKQNADNIIQMNSKNPELLNDYCLKIYEKISKEEADKVNLELT